MIICNQADNTDQSAMNLKSLPRMLLVDDDRHLLDSMSGWIETQGYSVTVASSVAQARNCIDQFPFDVAVVDVQLADGDGFQILRHCRANQPSLPVILMTGYGTVDTAIEALREGAYDLLTKPLIDEELMMAVRKAMSSQQILEENVQLKKQLDNRFGLENIIGSAPQMQRIYDVINSIADTRATVLITGESGTGKSLVARAIHRMSGRRDKPFVEVACGALPETLLESELFGHVAGAFTGATGNKEGKFAQANHGTLFLDEIGTASPAMQVKLLRVLQELQFEQVGGTKTWSVDTRVVLATNEDLQKAVAEGRFRQDLFYRINVINLQLPSLSERVADIPTLADHFLKQICENTGRKFEGFDAASLNALQAWHWPGNVRELQNVVERAVLLGKGPRVTIADLPAHISNGMPVGTVAASTRQSLKEALEGPERQIILQVLRENNWNRNETADQLGVNRTTLYKKMKRLGLENPREIGYPVR
jgi:DNA-binding NtrC family response regulator